MRGPGKTRLGREAYAVAIRMLAENYRRPLILRAIHERFPEHRSGEPAEVNNRILMGIAQTRKDEIEELRERLNAELDDLWIANKRQRLVALQEMFEDCNRWVPKKVIEPPWKPGQDDEKRPAAIVVYEKDVPGMLGVLKQAREELGVTAADRAAESIADLVRIAEEQRGLERTTTIDAHPVDAVEYIEEAMVVELAPPVRTKGQDAARGFLDGGAGSVGDDSTLELPWHAGEPWASPVPPPPSEKSGGKQGEDV
jgi:hypothetical protein